MNYDTSNLTKQVLAMQLTPLDSRDSFITIFNMALAIERLQDEVEQLRKEGK